MKLKKIFLLIPFLFFIYFNNFHNLQADDFVLREIVDVLNKTKVGRKLMDDFKIHQRLNKDSRNIEEIIQIQNTHSKITFHWSGKTKKVFKVIMLDGRLTTIEKSQQLIHELTHYLYDDSAEWLIKKVSIINQSTFSKYLDIYLKKRLEGQGGEIWSIINECRFLKSLNPTGTWRNNFCQKLFNFKEGDFSFSQAQSLIYQLGLNDFKIIRPKLNPQSEILDKINSQAPVFFSAHSSKSYPVENFEAFTKMFQKK